MDIDERATGLVLRRATAGDADDIAELLQANETTRGGSITGRFERAQVMAFIDDMPVVVARWRGGLAGVLISSSVAAVRHRPVIDRMLKAYPGHANAYVYGPICVDEEQRGRGVARMLFERLKAELPGREGILFIRQDNTNSIEAHLHMPGMQWRGSFALDGVGYVVLSYQD